MSQESSVWLNQNTLIGYTEKRGNAWHYRAADQGAEGNHYPGAVPIEDVRRRLFHWDAVEGDLVTNVLTEDGVLTITDPERKTIVRPDTQTVLGVFKNGYTIHQYREWLLNQIEYLLDDDLDIGSAGLLKLGGVAWVSIEVPENIVTPEGVEFRPHLLAATSLDGSLSTTYNRCITNVVCDNTMSAALSEHGQRIKVKHSRYSKVKLAEARDALGIIHSAADDFAAQVAELTSVKVSDSEWRKFVDAHTPVPEKEGRALTMAENKRETLFRLWNHDDRVTPWKNTAWGVVQAVNTADQHEFNVRGDRAERNMLKSISGHFDKLDNGTVKMLDGVLAAS